MIQFSFYVFVTHLICIVYLMNSGEEYIIQFAKSAGLTHTLLKVQFFVMSICYIGLAYSCIAPSDVYEFILTIAKKQLSTADYFLSVFLYVIIHVLWCTHFIDLSVRAHIYKHSKTGAYNTATKRLLLRIINNIFSPSKKHVK